jgi:hypothetical protein
MNYWFAVAAGLALAICGLHVIAGGREVVGPLLAASNLDPAVRYLHYYCWHLVTLVLAALAGAFAYASLVVGGLDLAVFAVGLSAVFALWSLGMIARYRLSVWQYPQWLLFTVLAALGLSGCIL